MIKITFPDGNVKEFAKGTTAYQIAESISPRLAADSLAASVNGATVDLNRAIEEDASIKFYKWDDPEGKHAFWHTSSHLLAEALEALYPGIKFGIGPAIENGFYYDVDSPVPITEADLETIEKKMIELSRNKEQLIRTEVSKADALKNFTEKGDPYKVELIRDLEDGTISFYTNGAFTDLCRGPHLPNTGLIKAIKLTSVAGAYWRGNEKNKMLTRIYGISFPKKSMLDEYLAMMEEAKKRDHRKLGKELELFCFSQRVGQGLPLWLPKGAALRDRLEQFLRGVQKEYGYQQVITPHIGNKELYVTSGHYAKYGKDSFQPIHTPIEGEEYLLKPMNCPHHCEIYRSKPRSYKELPVRLAADQGNAEAQWRLGDCYFFGHGVGKNKREAVNWYFLSAEKGNAEAQRRLGACFYFGHGVAKNRQEAIRWYRLAAEQGNSVAISMLKKLGVM